MTSVKEFRVAEPPTPSSLGRGAFVFSDAYSVFDWGRMPDPIPDKGAALCTMGAFNFERLDEVGVPTHYRGVVHDGDVVSLETALSRDVRPTEMAIDLTQVPELPVADGDYDYDAYHEAAAANYLVPLEIVFRNSVGVGSSLRRRKTPAEAGLPNDDWPAETVALSEPVVEFSTKYEEQDRYLDRAEAARIAGRADLEDLEALARTVNRVVTEQAAAAGLDHQDGKIECLYVDGEVRVADVVGTFDENRFALDGTPVSKEVLRQYHERSQPAWVEAVAAAKDTAKATDDAAWRERCDRQPAPLDPAVIAAVSDVYCAGTNAYCERTVFDAPTLEAALQRARRATDAADA